MSTIGRTIDIGGEVLAPFRALGDDELTEKVLVHIALDVAEDGIDKTAAD